MRILDYKLEESDKPHSCHIGKRITTYYSQISGPLPNDKFFVGADELEFMDPEERARYQQGNIFLINERNKSGLSQQQVANALDFSFQSRYASIEHGAQYPGEDSQRNICGLFNTLNGSSLVPEEVFPPILRRIIYKANQPVNPKFEEYTITFEEANALGLLPSASIDELGLDKKAMKRGLHYLLGGLSPREIEVFRLRFGFAGSHLTYEAIGQRFNLTRQRIRSIEQAALMKIRDSRKWEMFKNNYL